MVKKILLALLAVIAILIGLIVAQPASYKVVRSTTINAPQAEVFALINDFHGWDKWSPWAKLDPNMKTTYSGAGSGPGAAYHWVGNNDVGEGRMTITESKPGELVRMKLDFLKPFPSTSTAEFALKPEGSGTALTWTMLGKANFMMKCMGLIMNCDKMVGGQFEQGLTNLRSIVEPASKS